MIPSWSRAARAIGYVTFLEIIRDKVLYNVAFFASLVLGLGFLAARMSYAHPERIILDFGVSAVSLSCSLLACLAGSSLLNRELERRTAYVALSHPISKAQFIIGKYTGLAGVLVVNWLLISIAFLVILALTAGFQGDHLSPALGWGLGFALLQGLVLASVTIFFSTFSTTSMTLMFALGIYLIGNNLSQLQAIAAKSESRGISTLLNLLSDVLPNLEHFNVNTSNAITYGLPISGRFILTGWAYGIVVTAILLILSSLLIRTKEI